MKKLLLALCDGDWHFNEIVTKTAFHCLSWTLSTLILVPSALSFVCLVFSQPTSWPYWLQAFWGTLTAVFVGVTFSSVIDHYYLGLYAAPQFSHLSHLSDNSKDKYICTGISSDPPKKRRLRGPILTHAVTAFVCTITVVPLCDVNAGTLFAPHIQWASVKSALGASLTAIVLAFTMLKPIYSAIADSPRRTFIQYAREQRCTTFYDSREVNCQALWLIDALDEPDRDRPYEEAVMPPADSNGPFFHEHVKSGSQLLSLIKRLEVSEPIDSKSKSELRSKRSEFVDLWIKNRFLRVPEQAADPPNHFSTKAAVLFAFAAYILIGSLLCSPFTISSEGSLERAPVLVPAIAASFLTWLHSHLWIGKSEVPKLTAATIVFGAGLMALLTFIAPCVFSILAAKPVLFWDVSCVAILGGFALCSSCFAIVTMKRVFIGEPYTCYKRLCVSCFCLLGASVALIAFSSSVSSFNRVVSIVLSMLILRTGLIVASLKKRTRVEWDEADYKILFLRPYGTDESLHFPSMHAVLTSLQLGLPLLSLGYSNRRFVNSLEMPSGWLLPGVRGSTMTLTLTLNFCASVRVEQNCNLAISSVYSTNSFMTEDQSEWKSRIQDGMKMANWTVVLVGTTAGIMWEVRQSFAKHRSSTIWITESIEARYLFLSLVRELAPRMRIRNEEMEIWFLNSSRNGEMFLDGLKIVRGLGMRTAFEVRAIMTNLDSRRS